MSQPAHCHEVEYEDGELPPLNDPGNEDPGSEGLEDAPVPLIDEQSAHSSRGKPPSHLWNCMRQKASVAWWLSGRSARRAASRPPTS
ncbi:hypothetical protein [Pseudomonas sp. KNUC1026]|uniref:hypothetical protein n=1 Tax=Pseudomonas sp. KNUC1026 TaxID=2893890 RepID=UPI001F1C4BD7|nr:hypothetical protein [Pseudomonas sp. KNUC1026]UFH50958.1 hypothetical protein LN139_07740 [Pseudomonas sp. KNUC1026]